MRPPERPHQELVRLRRGTRALGAERHVGSEHCSLPGQLPLDERRHGRGNQARGRRAAREVVVDVDDLVERVHGGAERRQRQLSLGDAALLRGKRPVGVLDARRLVVDDVEDVLALVQVGEAGDAAKHRAAAERDHRGGLAPQQPGHLLLLRRADGAVDERRRQLAVVQRLDVLALEVERDRPERDVHELDDGQQVLAEVDHGLLAAAAGGAPVESDLRLRHRALPGGLRCRALGALQAQRPEHAQLLGHLVADPLHLLALGRRDPLEAQPLVLDAQVAEHGPEQLNPAAGLVVAFLVVAVPRVAAADEHPVRAVAEGREHELRIEPA